MVVDYTHKAKEIKALAHPVRLQILDMLRQGELCVCHIETALAKRQTYISQQLAVLREAGLVENRKEGLRVFYRLSGSTTAAGMLDAVCGPVVDSGHETLSGCPCPHCSNDA